MQSQILAVAYFIVAIAVSIFFIVRLKIYSNREAGGRGLIYSGLGLVVLTTAINIVQILPGYADWFISGVYPVIDIIKGLIFILGGVFFVIGMVMYFNYWGERDVEVANHLEKLKLLDTLQKESRFPYPMMELLDRILKGLLSGLGEQAGAIFLYNQNKRTFLLATSAGLKKEEIALLEYYPYGHNIVSQAIEDETPMITSDFRSLGGKAQLAASNYRSILVVPLKSGRSAQGAMLFFSPEERRYSREYISTIMPISEWLVEKIEVSRISRELKRQQNELKSIKRSWNESGRRLAKVLTMGDEPLTIDVFARRCLGLAGSDEAWLLGLNSGQLEIYGGTNNNSGFSENFRSAIINAIGNGKAVILNQEGTDESGHNFIARASILMPINKSGNALLLRNNSGPIRMSEEELQLLESIASVAGLILGRESAVGVGDSRRQGFEIISNVLRMNITGSNPEKSIHDLLGQIMGLLPGDSIQMLFEKRIDKLKVAWSNIDNSATKEISLLLGEGLIGRAAALRQVETATGLNGVSGALSQMDDENRGSFGKLFGERHNPVFMAGYPLIIENHAIYVYSVFIFSGSTVAHDEINRLISVLTGLLNLRHAINSAGKLEAGDSGISTAPALPGAIINDLNNELLSITGKCQLAAREQNLSGEVSHTLGSIEKSARKIAEKLKVNQSKVPLNKPITLKNTDINAEIKNLFARTAISGDLFMVDGRPCELNFLLGDIAALKADPVEFGNFIQGSLNAFVRGVGGDEVVTINTYADQVNIYVDISKHRKNFPPVEAVSGFGRYRTWEAAREVLQEKSLTGFLSIQNGSFAYDRFSERPSYFSFRFPTTLDTDAPSANRSFQRRRLTILAIDDQAIILDLLAAMCQSLGHEIIVSRNSEDGVRLLREHSPDVIVVDMAMPGMSGLELAGRLKAVSANTPVIMITGWGVQIEENRLARAGVDYVLHKPFRLEQLADIIEKLPIYQS